MDEHFYSQIGRSRCSHIVLVEYNLLNFLLLPLTISQGSFGVPLPPCIWGLFFVGIDAEKMQVCSRAKQHQCSSFFSEETPRRKSIKIIKKKWIFSRKRL